MTSEPGGTIRFDLGQLRATTSRESIPGLMFSVICPRIAVWTGGAAISSMLA